MRHKTMRQTKCSTEQAGKYYTVEAKESFSNESAELKVSQKTIILFDREEGPTLCQDYT